LQRTIYIHTVRTYLPTQKQTKSIVLGISYYIHQEIHNTTIGIMNQNLKIGLSCGLIIDCLDTKKFLDRKSSHLLPKIAIYQNVRETRVQ